jgi:hypothetical protein
LESAEILEILKTLTSQPKKTWLVSGTIQARHEEYRAPKTTDSSKISSRIKQEVQAYSEKPVKLELTQELQQMKLEAIPFNARYELSNEYVMVSNETVRFDVNRFYWEIVVDSRTDSVKPGAELVGNSYTEEFDLGWNQKRVFAWDGDKYTTYFRPGNSAIIRGIPGAVNGPLTAGIIPWGHGRYSYKHLSDALLSAIEVESDTQSEIHLTVIRDEREETFALDPSKDYAIRHYVSTSGNGSMIVRSYGGYQLVSGEWRPGDIIIEQYDTTTSPAKLMVSNLWDFTSISDEPPEAASFEVDFEYDALIKDFRFGSKPLQYRYSAPEAPSVKNVDVAELVQSRLQIAQLPNLQGQNCATVSLRYVCGKLGVHTPWEDLSQLVHGSDKRTSFFEMKGFVDGLGLNSLAVKTDLAALRFAEGYQAILHLPEDNHYVVLGNVGDDYVRLIDLDKNDFYYRHSIEHFESVWDNTALIVGNKPVTENVGFARIDDSRLSDIVGAASCQKCNTKIQDADDSGDCVCGSAHTVVYELYACGPSTTATKPCTEAGMIGSEDETCISDPNFDCVGDGEWTTVFSISACTNTNEN